MFTIRSLLLFFLMLLTVPAVVLADLVDINSADVETLAINIDGVGTQKAIAIVQYREANGPFSSLDDLANVRGIGMKTIDSCNAITLIRRRPVTTGISPPGSALDEGAFFSLIAAEARLQVASGPAVRYLQRILRPRPGCRPSSPWLRFRGNQVLLCARRWICQLLSCGAIPD